MSRREPGLVRQVMDKLEVQLQARINRQRAGLVFQVGQAVNELDRMTQQNAALVEQTAAAASAMKDQARALMDEVGRFRIPAGTQVQAEQRASVVDFDFEKAIEAHRQWKVKLRKAIAGQEQLDANVICRDDPCPLGKWIHGPGGGLWGHKPGFVELTARPAEFHQTAGEVARKINAGQLQDADRLIGSSSKFAQIATEVSTLLTKAKPGL